MAKKKSSSERANELFNARNKELLRARAERMQDTWGLEDHSYDPADDVGDGAWVMVTRIVPVALNIRPQRFGIYWALPGEDKWGRPKIRIHVPDEVCLLGPEYRTVDQAQLDFYRANGWSLHVARPAASPADMALVLQGRALCEDEREVIWALQLDGLTEAEACEEYFLGRHQDASHLGECWLPSPEVAKELEAFFG